MILGEQEFNQEEFDNAVANLEKEEELAKRKKKKSPIRCVRNIRDFKVVLLDLKFIFDLTLKLKTIRKMNSRFGKLSLMRRNSLLKS